MVWGLGLGIVCGFGFAVFQVLGFWLRLDSSRLGFRVQVRGGQRI